MLETARKLKEAADHCQSISRGKDTAQQLSDKCHDLHTQAVQQVPNTNESEHNHEAFGALRQLDKPASDIDQLAGASVFDAEYPR